MNPISFTHAFLLSSVAGSIEEIGMVCGQLTSRAGTHDLLLHHNTSTTIRQWEDCSFVIDTVESQARHPEEPVSSPKSGNKYGDAQCLLALEIRPV